MKPLYDGRWDASDFVDALYSHIRSEIGRVYWNVHQKPWQDEYTDPHIPGVEVRGYDWDPECDCGADIPRNAWEAQHPDHAADCYSSAYRRLDKKGGWCAPERDVKALCESYGIPWDNGYGCAVHCTCGHSAAYRAMVEQYPHAGTCRLELPNFRFENVGIYWYKYPGRGMETDAPLSEREWRQWLNRCLATIREADVRP